MSSLNAFPHITEFSDGYWLVEGLFVEPSEDIDVPLVQEHVYGHLQDEYYRGESTPMLLRHGASSYHFQVHPDEGVRIDTIEVPFEYTSDMEVGSPPVEEQFLLAKPKHAHMLYRMSSDETIEG